MATVETGGTSGTLAGLLKETYADKLEKLIPLSSVIQNIVPFVPKQKRPGNQYHQPVLVQYATNATWGTGGYTLNAINSSKSVDATLTGANIVHRDSIAYDLAAFAASGTPQSFEQAYGLVIENLYEVTSKYLELDLLYGAGGSPASGNSLAQTTTIAQNSATQATVTISYGTWSLATFAGMETAGISFYNAGTLVASATSYTIVSVGVVPATSTVGGTLVVTGTSGDITTLVALSGTTLDIYWLSAYGNQMAGLRAIMTNTGTLFGVNASTYSLWQSNTFNCQNTQLTFGKVQAAAAIAANRGLATKATLFTSLPTFANLVDEQAGARMLDQSYDEDKVKNGFTHIEYYSANGVIEVVPHMFVHQGEAFMLPKVETWRVGAFDDVVDTVPGMTGQFQVQTNNAASWEVRVMANQAVIVVKPAQSVILQSVVNV